jgi:hypothetical protein
MSSFLSLKFTCRCFEGPGAPTSSSSFFVLRSGDFGGILYGDDEAIMCGKKPNYTTVNGDQFKPTVNGDTLPSWWYARLIVRLAGQLDLPEKLPPAEDPNNQHERFAELKRWGN